MLTIVVLSMAYLSSVLAIGYGPRCFDCNYAPSGHSKQVDYWHQVSYNAGYIGCALTRYGDADSLDKWSCTSGQCFIRKDPNGLVYRGCANQVNLPRGVDPYKQCAYQAGSQWWFCNGDLCNEGQFGDANVCGYKPAYYAEYSPCDGTCYNNPSGLFSDPYNKNGFIQCGCDFRYGKACTCCKAFYQKCPYGTAFDDSTKVCSKAAYDPYYKPVPYKPEPVPYTPVKPVYKPAEPIYKPVEPVYKPVEPVYQPVELVYKPVDPVYKTVEPKYKPVKPVPVKSAYHQTYERYEYKRPNYHYRRPPHGYPYKYNP